MIYALLKRVEVELGEYIVELPLAKLENVAESEVVYTSGSGNCSDMEILDWNM